MNNFYLKDLSESMQSMFSGDLLAVGSSHHLGLRQAAASPRIGCDGVGGDECDRT